ncbi:MAG: ribonuclease III [Fidelibacterota bacterium]
MTQIVRRLKWRLLKRDHKLAQLQRTVGYFFDRKDILVRSITHKSVHSHSTRNYEQLEFLGDTIIDYVISERLISEFPEGSEGLLTQKRAALVRRSFLANMAATLGLLDFISVMPFVDLTQEKVSQKQLANVFEAVTGGMYLDGGIKPCRNLIERTVWNHRQEAWRSINYKGLLLEYCQANDMDNPRFLVTNTTGPEHEKSFHVTVQIGDRTFPPRKGATKKAAEQEAAEIALDFLKP